MHSGAMETNSDLSSEATQALADLRRHLVRVSCVPVAAAVVVLAGAEFAAWPLLGSTWGHLARPLALLAGIALFFTAVSYSRRWMGRVPARVRAASSQLTMAEAGIEYRAAVDALLLAADGQAVWPWPWMPAPVRRYVEAALAEGHGSPQAREAQIVLHRVCSLWQHIHYSAPARQPQQDRLTARG